MRSLLLVFALAVAVQEQPPYTPGNPNHEEPPEGWHCFTNSPSAPAPDGHACDCHTWRTCTKDPETGKNVIVEHPSCRSWCFKDHCLCAVHCEDTE